jgi:NADPH:quinone reductase-like Zn-dependent oxidoreductase
MKAVLLERYGTPGVLQLKDVAKPEPKAGDVLVRVQAASINDWDWALLRGDSLIIRLFYGLFTPKVRIIGSDIAGRVEAVGRDVTAFKPGDDVYGDLCMNGFGGFAEYVCAPEASLARKPARMTFEQAAAIPQAGMLAVQGLIDVGRIQRGQTLLLNGAGGGVGTFALQIAKDYDSHVTVVDKGDKLDVLRALGADRVIDYLKEDFTRGGRTYDLILDTKTNRSPFAYLRALNPGGTYVTVGGSIPRLLEIALLSPAIPRLYHKHVKVVGLKPNKDLAYIGRLFEAARLVPVIDRTYTLDELPNAFQRFGASDHKGKMIVTIAG